ncbi:alpha/beta fold hydrolase [Amycolatopsis lurida]|uniref:Alpha/beta hydrolase n=1 Tax=Amycolatopsis lurida NRRL 2430 TaxID=1460371 RepID=A0A2P2FMP1_AMYLU|nr:alpha/beta hydrolase [Amycolatopsis lurida]KFU78003.1 alpha/beta hydrolase [Amycolatopsis lurida NRRL 2430]
MDFEIDAPARLGETGLPDGRVLGWAEWGPPDGEVVLLIPGAATSRRLGLSAGVVESLNVRLVTVDRPGLGSSSPLEDRTFADFAADIACLAGERGFGVSPMIANSQGAPFAFACAAAGAAGPLAIVSGADEISRPEFTGTLPDELAGLVALVVSDPARAEAVFTGYDADALWNLVTRSAPDADLAVYTAPSFESAYRRAMAEAFGQGPAGYARDTVLAMGRWPFALSSITGHVDLWYGEQDRSHSPDNGVTLAGRLPDATLRIVPGIGGAVLWTHAAEILRALLGRDGQAKV